MTSTPALRFDASRNLTVTAHLAHGVVVSGEAWPLLLDGLLEGAVRRQSLGDGYYHGRDLSREQQDWLRTPAAALARSTATRPPWLSTADAHTRRPRLPLATYGRSRPCLGAQWVWLASAATWPDKAELDLRWWHSRFDSAAAERVCGSRLPAQVYDTHGRYRSYRTPLPVVVTPVLMWRCVGNPDGVRTLTELLTQLGKKRAQGEGLVTRWEVTDEGVGAEAWALWTESGHLARPVPARAAAHLGVADPQTVWHNAIRPPYWRPAPTGEGGFGRQRREVLAPATLRPG